ISQAISAYEQALELERQIGNQDQVAAMLGNLAYEYLQAGNPAAAGTRLDEMEKLATGRTTAQAERCRALQRLAVGELAGAREHLEHVRQVFFETGQSRGVELRLLGDVLVAQGEIGQARSRYEQYLARGWPQESTSYLSGLTAQARLAVEEGKIEL